MVFVVSVKRVVASLLATALFLVALTDVRGTGSAEVFLKTTRKIPVYSVETEEKTVALTFDAAYGADKTSAIMDVLEREGVPATFFLVGFWVKNFPDKTAEIARRGFEIGTHSNVHGHMNSMTSEAISSDLDQSVERIRQASGVTPRLFRAPYGEYNDRLISIAEEKGLTCVQWSVDSLDWKNESANAMITRVKSKVHSGAIVLMHNNSDYVVDALPAIIAYLKSENYVFKTVGDLVYEDNYYIDNSGRQHLKN